MPLESALSIQNRVSKAISDELSRLPKTGAALRAIARKLNAIASGGGPALLAIETPFGFADFGGGTKSSATSIPAGANVLFAYVQTTTAFDTGTIDVGRTGSTSLLLANASVDLTIIQFNGGPSGQAWGTTALPVLLTFGGGPTVGAGKIMVVYGTPGL